MLLQLQVRPEEDEEHEQFYLLTTHAINTQKMSFLATHTFKLLEVQQAVN